MATTGTSDTAHEEVDAIRALTLKVDQLSAKVERDSELQRLWLIGASIITTTAIVTIAAITGLLIPIW